MQARWVMGNEHDPPLFSGTGKEGRKKKGLNGFTHMGDKETMEAGNFAVAQKRPGGVIHD